MLNLGISSPGDQTEDVLRILRADPGVSSLAVMRDASLQPVGDLVIADVAREAANDVVGALGELGIHREGSLRLEPVSTWLSQAGYDAERKTPGSGADAVVWPEVTQRACEDSELNWTYLSFMTPGPGAVGGLHLGHHGPGSGKRRPGPRVRRRRRDLGQHPAAADQPDRNGARRVGHPRPAEGGLVKDVGQTGQAHTTPPAAVTVRAAVCRGRPTREPLP